MATSEAPLVCVLGATGYVGGRLVPRLLDAGYRVRCLVRSPSKLARQPWEGDVEVIKGDVTVREDVDRALEGVDGVYYLIHQMGSATDFAAADRAAALNVAFAATAHDVRRIVYLGGLGELGEESSRHLASRGEVAEILTAGLTPATVLRAAIVIGSGSASFEMLRHLTEKLPVMVCPRWVDARIQPIAIRDVLRYLLAAMDITDSADHDIDIGGPDVLTYRQMMQRYAAVAGLPRRLIFPVPVLTPRLSSHWVNLVTPVPFGVAKPLVESLGTDVVVREDHETGADLDPAPAMPLDEAIGLALERIADQEVETSWREADLAGRSPAEPYPGDPEWAGGVLLRDVRELTVDATPEKVFRAVARIGGDRGWPTHQWAWTLRGWVDIVVGGVGLRRGRRDPDDLRTGDALDFWRVEAVEPPELLRLRAEMRVPGQAWLEFRIDAVDGDRTRLQQRALFAPRGLLGRAYWWAMLPFHGPIFSSMLTTLAADAAALDGGERPHVRDVEHVGDEAGGGDVVGGEGIGGGADGGPVGERGMGPRAQPPALER